jgi:tyrosine-protein kinase Etk/Wzc
LTQKYNLYARYQFDSTTTKSRHDFNEHFKELYTIEKNKLDAVELSIEDTDPKFAQEITLEARKYIDQKVSDLIRITQGKIVASFGSSLKQQEKDIAKLEDSLRTLRRNFGIYNTETQSKIITDLTSVAQARLARVSAQVKALEKEPNANQDTIIMMRSLVKGLENELSVLNKSNVSTFNQGMGVIDVLTQIQEQKRKQMGYDVVRLEQMRAAQDSKVSALYIVEEPRVPEIKSRPKRSLLVLAAVFITFVSITLGAILLENYKKIDWQSVKNID